MATREALKAGQNMPAIFTDIIMTWYWWTIADLEKAQEREPNRECWATCSLSTIISSQNIPSSTLLFTVEVLEADLQPKLQRIIIPGILFLTLLITVFQELLKGSSRFYLFDWY